MFRFLLLGSPARAVRSGLVVAALFFALPVAAQQVAVDDAGITDPGACQLEAWLGQTNGVVQPACTFFGRTEITVGFGYVDEPHGDHTHRHTEFFGEAKINILPDDPGMLGASVVLGAGWAAEAGIPFEGVFGYVPLTYTLANERALIHANLGAIYETEDEVTLALYGLRTDFVVHDRVTVLGEVFGVGEELGAQAGFRFSLIPDLFDLDLTYGATLRGDAPDLGFTVGVSVTPSAFFRPLRF